MIFDNLKLKVTIDGEDWWQDPKRFAEQQMNKLSKRFMDGELTKEELATALEERQGMGKSFLARLHCFRSLCEGRSSILLVDPWGPELSDLFKDIGRHFPKNRDLFTFNGGALERPLEKIKCLANGATVTQVTYETIAAGSIGEIWPRCFIVDDRKAPNNPTPNVPYVTSKHLLNLKLDQVLIPKGRM